MYRPFRLTGFDPPQTFLENYGPIGQQIWNDQTAAVHGKLTSYLLNDGTLDGEKMRSNWFPQIEADIFLSHSHQDKSSAIALAGWIKNVFGLRCFIDSCVWGDSENLLQAVDNAHCISDWDRSIYDYKKRNGSTSHVHMMLATALTMMIDKTECAILLDTANSIAMRSHDAVARTRSPWILCEIAAMEMIRRQEPERMLKKAEEQRSRFDEIIGETGGPRFLHTVSFKELTQIDVDTLNKWKSEWARKNRPEVVALDTLYRVAPDNTAKRVTLQR